MGEFKTKPVLRLKQFSDVFISSGNGLIKKILLQGFDALGGIQKFIAPGQSVLLKPNLVVGVSPMSGGNIDVGFCEAVIEMLRENCSPGKITVGENTESGPNMMQYFERNGYVDMCKRQGVDLVDLALVERVDIPLEGALFADIVNIPKLVRDVDVFITMPCLKNHDTVCLTAAIKNSYGIVTNESRRQAHRSDAIEQHLVDIARVRKPDFCIVDGRIGQEGIAGGSHFDHPRFANRIIMGADPVAVDTVCAHIMEQNPRVRYLQWADEYGLGNCNLDYINIHGMPLEEAKVRFMTPAEHIEENSGGQFRLTDLGSCSRCRAVAQGTLHRFRSPESVLKKVDIAYGPADWAVPADLSENCLLIGDCIQERYRSLGTWISGCPMNRDDYFNALTSMDIVCSKCMKAVNEFIERHSPEELAFVRILASNKTVFRSEFNLAGATDFLISVGECQRRYAYFHIRRSASDLIEKGLEGKIGADFFVYVIPGHDPSQEDLEAALAELKGRAVKWEEIKAGLGA